MAYKEHGKVFDNLISTQTILADGSINIWRLHFGDMSSTLLIRLEKTTTARHINNMGCTHPIYVIAQET